jgi:putative ATPase
VYLARAPKSNAVYRGYAAAAADVAETANEPVPLHLRNGVTALMKGHGYGRGYRYAHDDPAAREEMRCLPEGLADRRYLEGLPEPPRE